MKPVFWTSLAIVLYTYAGYPLAIALLARLRPRPWQRAPLPLLVTQPPISIVMAVHNGAAMLPDKLKHLLALDSTLVREVIVVSDGSTDTTKRILTQTPAQKKDPRLHSIILPTQVGKSAALNPGIAHATGDILLFVDIRPRIEPNALAHLLSNFADPTVGCVAGELLLPSQTKEAQAHSAATSAVSGLYWRYEQWIRNCEAAVDSPVGVYGGFYAIRRALATPLPEGLILDDMFQPLSILRQGYRSVLDRHALVTDRWPTQTAGEFQRKVRTLAGNFQLIAQAPWLLTPRNRVLFQLTSHKLLRLIVPYCFLALLIASATLGFQLDPNANPNPTSPDPTGLGLTLRGLPFALFFTLQALFWLLATLSLKFRLPLVQRLAGPASALLVLNAAAIAGLFKFLFTPGPLWKIWTPTPTAPASTPRSKRRRKSR